MFDLENISVDQFLKLDEKNAQGYFDLMEILKSSGTVNNAKAIPLGELTYGEVSEFKQLAISINIEGIITIFCKVFSITEKELLKLDIVQFLSAIKYLTSEIKELVQREIKSLKSDIDPDMQMAGIDKMAVFGEFSTLISLGKEFGKSPIEIEKWKYNTVFAIILHDKTHAGIMKRYSQLKSSRNGH